MKMQCYSRLNSDSSILFYFFYCKTLMPENDKVESIAIIVPVFQDGRFAELSFKGFLLSAFACFCPVRGSLVGLRKITPPRGFVLSRRK